MTGFRLICGNCGSDSVLEKSAYKILDRLTGSVKYAEGLQRKCLGCNNEEFILFKTGLILNGSFPLNFSSDSAAQVTGRH